MITPEIRSLDCADLGVGVEPADPEEICLSITASIGLAGTPGADNFDFLFVTPHLLKRMARERKEKKWNVIHHFNWDAAREHIEEKCRQSSGCDWPDICRKLCQWAHWEYEDYRG